jgi:hypothetical protein
MATAASSSSLNRPLVQIASYNTALQGFRGVPQDLVDWLSPTLKVSKFLSREPRAPDIVAVGFQELLPLHQGRMYCSDLLLFDSSHLNGQEQLLAAHAESSMIAMPSSYPS